MLLWITRQTTNIERKKKSFSYKNRHKSHYNSIIWFRFILHSRFSHLLFHSIRDGYWHISPISFQMFCCVFFYCLSVLSLQKLNNQMNRIWIRITFNFWSLYCCCVLVAHAWMTSISLCATTNQTTRHRVYPSCALFFKFAACVTWIGSSNICFYICCSVSESLRPHDTCSTQKPKFL